MTLDSATSLLQSRVSLANTQGPESSVSSVYSSSETTGTTGKWIQPPVTEQALDLSRESLVAGIYVQTPREEMIVATVQEWNSGIEAEVARMAADPEIQREIGLIQSEFDVTEGDGLPDDV